jgi:CRP-like cAMP-binding protein
MRALVIEVRRVSTELSQALYLPAEARVWKRVADLTRLYETAANDVVTIPLTQEDVAHMAGTTRPTANKVLRSGEEKGVLRISRGRIEVLDVTALTKLAR